MFFFSSLLVSYFGTSASWKVMLLAIYVDTLQRPVTWIIMIRKKKSQSDDYETRSEEIIRSIFFIYVLNRFMDVRDPVCLCLSFWLSYKKMNYVCGTLCQSADGSEVCIGDWWWRANINAKMDEWFPYLFKAHYLCIFQKYIHIHLYLHCLQGNIPLINKIHNSTSLIQLFTNPRCKVCWYSAIGGQFVQG